MIQLTSAQRNLISRLDVDISTGLSTSEANSRRRRSSSSNIVAPPINCPKWICCLLPCISKTPSMVAFAAVTPDDVEVLRNTHWVRYDAASLVVGDVIRLDVHDVVPADCVVIVGHGYAFHHHDNKLLTVCCAEEEDEKTEYNEEEKLIRQSSSSSDNKDDNNNNNHNEEGAGLLLTVDARLITGESNMTTHYYSPSSSSTSSSYTTTTTNQLQTLLYGSRIVNGSCIAIVTAIGNNVVLSKLITTKRWPPKYDMSREIYDISNMEINNL